MTIREFPLAWRWTQASHTVLPNEVLDQLLPLDAAEAMRLSAIALGKKPPGILFPTNYSDPTEARMWLRRVQPDLEVRVYVSWNQHWAIEANWNIFTHYWDAFCYPSSDDIMVIPFAGSWRLDYHHYEQLEFRAGL